MEDLGHFTIIFLGGFLEYLPNLSGKSLAQLKQTDSNYESESDSNPEEKPTEDRPLLKNAYSRSEHKSSNDVGYSTTKIESH